MNIFQSGSKEDNKRTMIAVVLSVIVVTVGFVLQDRFFPAPVPAETVATTPPAASGGPTTIPIVAGSQEASFVTASPLPEPVSGPAPAAAATVPSDAVPVANETYRISTNLVDVTLTNAGGEIVSLKLKRHREGDSFVDMIVPGSQGTSGFSVSFGTPGTPAVRDLMNAKWLDAERRTLEFTRTFYAAVPGSSEKVPFVFRKTFTFRDDEYMFGLAVSLENSRNETLPLAQNGYAYSIAVGPQIGPRFDALPKNSDFRKYITLTAGKKKNEQVKPNVLTTPRDQPTWAALSGKYFTLIAVPDLVSFGTSFLMGNDPKIQQTDTMFISRPSIRGSRQTDSYYFYFGPKTTSELARYDYADRNAFGRAGLRLEEAMDRSNILGWLESILKFFMNLFYKLIPNYGVAIILTTILMKAIMFPLTRQGSMGSARMQELQPKMAEIQAKYKGNPQKLNQELAAFYKAENYNPMSGCLPMLIQLPLFIAMYNLFNNHFDLRGANFIAGWIHDLSLPESILNFGSFRLPVLGWSDLRALPIIYVASQLLYGKFTQTPTTGQNAGQMKFMMYGMPIMFFFILYDVPSGLLIYWIASNVLTIVQQIAINDMLKKRKAAAATKAAATKATSATTTARK